MTKKSADDKMLTQFADVVELADTLDLGSSAVRHAGSSPVIRTTSEQALYRLLRLFIKSQSAFTPLLLLSKSNPLRWALIWLIFIGGVKSVMNTRTKK